MTKGDLIETFAEIIGRNLTYCSDGSCVVTIDGDECTPHEQSLLEACRRFAMHKTPITETIPTECSCPVPYFKEEMPADSGSYPLGLGDA